MSKRNRDHSITQVTTTANQRPQLSRSVWQIVNSMAPYLILWYLMYRSLDVSYWLTLGLSILGAGFLTRIFIIFHDCGHGAFFKSKRANKICGFITGLMAFTPHHQWWHDHAVHHATAGDLDRRGFGDIWTMTVEEYRSASRWQRLGYRLYRNPFVMFGVGALYLFVIRNRFPTRGATKRERSSVHWTNLALTLVVALLVATIGLNNFLLVQTPIMVVGLASGVWLFYVQHQFEPAYWAEHENWDYLTAALEGSSFYKLPRVLQWFSGNIGFHHVHHYSPRVPNYHLERCHKENPLFHDIRPITLGSSLRCLTFRLWDQEGGRLVGFRFLKTQNSESKLAA